MNNPWNETQGQLKKWQKEGGSAWELRRILSDSAYFNVIAICAHKRAPAAPEHADWREWWGYHLERVPEREAISLLLNVWNKDVIAHISHQIRMQAQNMMANGALQSTIDQKFDQAMDQILSENFRHRSR